MKKTLKGKVTKIIYQGDGGYTIAMVNFDKEFFTTSIKGVMDVEVNINYEFEGEMKDDDKFGEYFHVYKCEREKLTEKDQVLNYLTSKNFTGIGLRTATKIFNEFGEDTLEVIKNEPERLRDLGISEMAVQELYSKISTNDLLNDFYKELSKFGFTEFLIQEIYKYFTTHKITNPLSELRNQPFKYVDKINGFNFSKADTIFQERNDELDNEDRIFCGLVSSIENHCFQTGDTGV